jgi:hypothetical protein
MYAPHISFKTTKGIVIIYHYYYHLIKRTSCFKTTEWRFEIQDSKIRELSILSKNTHSFLVSSISSTTVCSNSSIKKPFIPEARKTESRDW